MLPLPMSSRSLPALFVVGGLLIATTVWFAYELLKPEPPTQIVGVIEEEDGFGRIIEAPVTSSKPVAIPTPTPSPTPSPTPLSYADMNRLYGPCASVPVLMYHHIQPAEKAAERGQASLTVQTPIFRQHLEYLRDHGYTTITPADLAAFFDTGKELPSKPVLLTFDDGYDNFVSDAVPLLRDFGFAGSLYLSTGLVENPTYLKWNDLENAIKGSKITVANHTWSHRNMKSSEKDIAYEVDTAQKQLTDHGYGADKSFAYPYGITSQAAINHLQQNGYSLAFTTESGRTQCKGRRFLLPRIRVGNSSLPTYGL